MAFMILSATIFGLDHESVKCSLYIYWELIVLNGDNCYNWSLYALKIERLIYLLDIFKKNPVKIIINKKKQISSALIPFCN